MKIAICPLCAAVSGSWLLLQALILGGYIKAEIFMPVVLLLMGGTVVGIADRIKRQKPPIVAAGMILAFLAAQNLSFWVLAAEIAILAVIAYALFYRPSAEKNENNSKKILEEKLKDCC